jgi:hypothetical protein
VTPTIDDLLAEAKIPVTGPKDFDIAAALRRLAADASRRTPPTEIARAAQAGQRLGVVCGLVLPLRNHCLGFNPPRAVRKALLALALPGRRARRVSGRALFVIFRLSAVTRGRGVGGQAAERIGSARRRSATRSGRCGRVPLGSAPSPPGSC